MSIREDYEAKLPVITAIPADEIVMPGSIPVDVYVQEASDLHHWCVLDMEVLTAAGANWGILADIPSRVGALREAESIWTQQRRTREEAAQQWAVDSEAGFDLRRQLLHDFRFAFRNDAALLKLLKYIVDGSSYADMIQDLNDLSVAGKANAALLEAVNFDLTLLDAAAQAAHDLTDLRSEVNGEKAGYREAKKIRDQAYTHLKKAVDMGYQYGKYVFWEDEERLQKYRSQYLWTIRTKKPAADTASSETEGEPCSVCGNDIGGDAAAAVNA